MIILIKSRSSKKLGQVASKPWTLVQMIKKPFVHSREHRFDLKFMKLFRMLIPITSRSDLKLVRVGSKTML